MENTATDSTQSGLYRFVLNSKDDEESQRSYSNWASTFDEDLRQLGHNMHLQVAKLVNKYCPNSKDAVLLDVGAGTGLTGFRLRDNDFLGQIDILDANMDMLYEASKKDLNFRNIVRHWVVGEFPLSPNSYDVITCVGSLLPLHLPPSTLQGMVSLLKSGGYMIFNIRRSVSSAYVDNVLNIIDQLKNEGKMEVVEMKEVQYNLTEDSAVCEVYVCKVK